MGALTVLTLTVESVTVCSVAPFSFTAVASLLVRLVHLGVSTGEQRD